MKDPDQPAICQKLRRFPRRTKELIQNHVDQLEKAGIVEVANSEYALPILPIVKERDEHGQPLSIRLAVDARLLNNRIRYQTNPIPDINRISTTLAGKRFFTKVDMILSFHQIPVTEQASRYLSFRTAKESYHYKRLIFGLRDAGNILVNQVHRTLNALPPLSFFCYVDDIVLAAADEKQMLALMRQLFKCLADAGWKLKSSKCKIFQTKIEIVGRIVEDGKIGQTQARSDAIRNLSPKNGTGRTSLLWKLAIQPNAS